MNVQRAVGLITCIILTVALDRFACGATLIELSSGGTLQVGSSLFSDWQVASGTSTINLSQIVVNPAISDPLNPGLQFVGNGQLSVTNIRSVDLEIRFRVTTLPGANSYTGNSLQATGLTFTGSAEKTLISAEPSDSLGAHVGAALVFADNEINFFQLNNASSFAPRSDLFVVLSILVAGTVVGDSANLSSYVYRLTQTGSPGLPGDYNGDGKVDAADFVVWRKNQGPPEGYNIWRSNFGVVTGLGSLSTGSTSAAVPEPSYAILFLSGMLFLYCGMSMIRVSPRYAC